jgi:hypothetical protein
LNDRKQVGLDNLKGVSGRFHAEIQAQEPERFRSNVWSGQSGLPSLSIKGGIGETSRCCKYGGWWDDMTEHWIRQRVVCARLPGWRGND